MTNSQVLNRLPSWLRWILVLPTAIASDLVTQSLGRIGIFIYDYPQHIVNPLVWHTIAPYAFVSGGAWMTPAYRSVVIIILCLWRISMSIFNIYNIFDYVNHGGSWSNTDPITYATMRWTAWTMVFGIGILIIPLKARFKRSLKKSKA